jgi:hypothetical protein
MQRAARRGGTAQVLRWLAIRTGAAVVLVDRSGVMARRPPSPLGIAERDLVVRAVREATSRGTRSVAIDQGDVACLVLPVDCPPEARAPLLAAVLPRPTPPDLPLLLADATSTLSLCWQVENTRLQQKRLRIAEARNREAVLRLLLNGHVTAARQVAAALRPELPDVARFYVIEGPLAQRGAAASALAAVTEDLWIVPCPVYADHLALLEPADPGTHPDEPPQWSWPTSVTETCWVGVSDPVPLRDTATGYAQAVHALAAARQSTERRAAYAGHPDLALTLGPAVASWAAAFLAPLHAHRPRRPQDPDSSELLATAASWLSFSSRATAHLKIHRNTLTARLTLIQQLLGLDLNRLDDQAALNLALRAHGAPIQPRPEQDTARPGGTPPSLDELLAHPHVLAWAHRQVGPVRTPEVPAGIDQTLTTWLRHDARIGPTAAALSISASTVRKRLARSEALLQRSLLRPPGAVHDLWFALRALNLAEQSSAVPSQP